MAAKKTAAGATAKKTKAAKKGAAGEAEKPAPVEVVDGKVEWVKVSEVKHELVDADLVKRGLPPGGSLPERISRLVLWYRANTPEGDLGDCNVCGGDSNADEKVCPACPYCGVAGVLDTPAAPATGAAAPAPVVAPAPAAPSAPQAAPPAAAAPTAAPPAAAPTAAPPAAKGPEALPAGGKAAKAAPEAKAPAAPAGGKLAVAPAATPAPAPVGKTFTVADLDKQLADIEIAKRGEVGCFWDHGKAIHVIFADKLYLQRRGKGDKPVYETFGSFAEEELGMTGQSAFRMMDVAANFDRDTAIRIGVKKLNAVLRAKPESRAKLLEGAEKVTVAVFEEKVAKVVEKEQAGKPEGRGRLSAKQADRNAKGSQKAVAKGSAIKATNVAAPPPDPKEKVTAALALGKLTVKLFKGGEKIASADAKRAKCLADEPFGVEETVNGVTSTYTLGTDAEGCLVLRITRKRV